MTSISPLAAFKGRERMVNERESWDLDEAFVSFVRSCSGRLLHSAYLLVGDHGHAEDLLQTALVRTARRWEAARQAPEAYTRRVLVNLSRDRQRSLGRRVRERPFTDHPSGLHSDRYVFDHAARVIGRDVLIEALHRLPLRQREVIVMRFFADLTIPETAAALGTSEGTVKSHTRRALRKLRHVFPDEERRITTTEVLDAE